MTLGKSDLFCSSVCMRRETITTSSAKGDEEMDQGHEDQYIPVRTNWPTVAAKPARKALKGCTRAAC